MKSGTRLGPYEIQEQLGAGGMGEVYLAQDTRLGREVAIKVLPAELSSDPEQLTRLEREARMLAALDHPNVATVHGLEESEGVRFLVMQRAKGETLADRLVSGPVPPREAASIAAQIAAGMEAAHEQGIVHRDLKPANVMVDGDGNVKLLDFGLARPNEAVESPADGLTASPTMMVATAAGVIMGTAPYMSPEQARGKRVDKRTDIWAFGVVLYEMLTGSQPFAGETVSDCVAAILTLEPDLDAVPPTTDGTVRWVLDRCLDKDPRSRLRDIGEARIALSAESEGPLPAVDPGARPVLLGAVAVGAALAGAVLGSMYGSTVDQPPVSSVLRFTLPTPELKFRGYSAGVHFSPDGRTVAYHGENLELRLRDLSTWQARSVPGTANSRDGFLSPDGRWFAYMNDAKGALEKVLLDGGTPVTLVRGIGIFNSGAWSGDGVLYFTAGIDGQVDLWRINEDGSDLRPVLPTEPGAAKSFYGQVQLLPGDRALLVTRVPDELEASGAEIEDAQIWALMLDDLTLKLLVEGAAQARYLPGGYLVVLTPGGSLSVVEFDLATVEVRGTPRRVVEGIRQNDGYINGRWTVSAAGALAYVVAPGTVEPGQLLWVEPDGSLSPAVDVPRTTRAGFSYNARLDPAGRTVALSLAGTSGRVNVWLLDVERGTGAPFLPGESWESFSPSWSPDGTHLAFVRATSMFRGGDIKVAPVDGSAAAETIYQTPDDDGDIIVRDLTLGNWTPDGSRLCFAQISPEGRSDIWVVDTTPGGASNMVLGTGAEERSPQFSPDGRWLAYASDVTGRLEIYLRAYPEGSRDIPVSGNGGDVPVWSPDGDRLYYRQGGTLVAVDIDRTDGSGVQIGRSVALAELTAELDDDYSVALDTGRILVAQGTRIPDSEEIHVVLGFADEVRAGAPERSR